ncbi:MAG: hypothetical protein ACYTEV_04110 [Planctomycetota bacterium]
MPAMHPHAPWLAMVALRHVRPGREDHVDWLLAREDPPSGPLRSFRCRACPTGIAGGAIGLRAMADHRRHYLAYEGPVSGDRGHVERIAAGRYRLVAGDPDGPGTLELRWDAGERTSGDVMLARIDAGPPTGAVIAPPPEAEHPGEPVLWIHHESPGIGAR